MTKSTRNISGLKSPCSHHRKYLLGNHLFTNTICLIVVILLAGCTVSSATITSIPATQSVNPPTQISFQSLKTPTIEISQPPYTIWVDPKLPSKLLEIVKGLNVLEITLKSENSQFLIIPTTENIFGYWIYVVVVPFSSPLESFQTEDFLNLWRFGKPDETELYLSSETIKSLSILWGDPKKENIIIAEEENLLSELWNKSNSIAVIPFERIEPRLKILTLDNMNPLENEFSPSAYPLALPLSIINNSNVNISDQLPVFTNFSRDKLTSVALTGVTAMVRDTASIMEEKGVRYPAKDILSILVNADITHISNEVPFAEDCPSPDPNQPSLFFCSKDDYIQLLEAVGTDIVELSGDHFGDWGPEAMLHSLDLYHQRNWLTYGGGETLQAGLDPVYIEHNGNQIAFIGCNGKVHDIYATATEDNPGASRCDFEWMLPEITRLSDEGHLVIATMQHEEVDSFNSIAIQQYDFRRLADAGATIVSGSQAHHPQAVEFRESSFIHYGLGNLFFDQWYLATHNPTEHENKDKAFIDIHYFYDGSYINTRLIPIQFLDNARSRPMTSEEASDFLAELHRASVWNLSPE